MKKLTDIFLLDDLTISAAFYATVAAMGDLSLFDTDSEALILQLESALNMQLSSAARAKVLAGLTVYTTDLVYKDLPAFIEFCNLASDSTSSDADVFDPADAYEIAWGRIEMAVIDPEQEEKLDTSNRSHFMRKSRQAERVKMTFDPEILRYCGAMLIQEGAIRPIFSIPDAILPEMSNADAPELLDAGVARHREVEQSIARYVLDNADIMLDQLAQIPTRDGQPLITPDLRDGIMKSLSLA